MAKKKYTKKQKKAAEAALRKTPKWIIAVAIVLIIVLVACYFVYDKYYKKSEPPLEAKGAISFHFLTLGNTHSGDCIYIKAGDTDILIDAGSKSSSVPTIAEYVNRYVTDGVLEYVIVTHAHEDHYAGFAGSGSSDTIFDLYDCKTIIDFPMTNNTDDPTAMYERYVAEREAEIAQGAKHYTALECYKNENGASRTYTLADSVTMEVLYNYYYDHKTSNENDYSVCVKFTHGDRNFLFTGDLEKNGEEKLVENNSLTQAELFKAGHHGSKTASTTKLIDVIQPKICVVSAVSCYNEYKQSSKDDYFPAKSVVNNVTKYGGKIYVTSIAAVNALGKTERQDLNGNVVVSSEESGVTVNCSAEYKKTFTEHEWHLTNRAA